MQRKDERNTAALSVSVHVCVRARLCMRAASSVCLIQLSSRIDIKLLQKHSVHIDILL